MSSPHSWPLAAIAPESGSDAECGAVWLCRARGFRSSSLCWHFSSLDFSPVCNAALHSNVGLGTAQAVTWAADRSRLWSIMQEAWAWLMNVAGIECWIISETSFMTKEPGVVQVGWSWRLFWPRGFLFEIPILGILDVVTFYHESRKFLSWK